MAHKDVPTNTKCQEPNCNNKAYAYDYISPIFKKLYCRKHYYMYAYGYDEYTASKK